MFNLEEAIASWRRQLSAGNAIEPVSLDELESHLRDAIETKTREGVELEVAFHRSIFELGEAETLKSEFQTAHPNSPRRARIVRTACILLIAISALLTANFFSPADAQKIFAVLIALGLFGLFLAKYIAATRFKSSDPDLSAFSPSALETLKLARAEAPRLHHDYAGTEHLLLGISAQIPGLFNRLGINRDTIRAEIQKLVGIGPSHISPQEIPLTPRAKHALRLADEEAKKLGHSTTTPEHVFLGLLREPSGVASHLLKNLGVKIDSARKEVLQQMRGSSR
jgi:hypothetical protein